MDFIPVNDEKKIITPGSTEFFDLPNRDFPIDKFFYNVEDDFENIKKKYTDEIIAKTIEYDMKKDVQTLNELAEMIKQEQEQNKLDFELLTLDSTSEAIINIKK
jgi:hypothetical protein